MIKTGSAPEALDSIEQTFRQFERPLRDWIDSCDRRRRGRSLADSACEAIERRIKRGLGAEGRLALAWYLGAVCDLRRSIDASLMLGGGAATDDAFRKAYWRWRAAHTKSFAQLEATVLAELQIVTGQLYDCLRR